MCVGVSGGGKRGDKGKGAKEQRVEKHTLVQVQCAERSGAGYHSTGNVYFSHLFCRIIAVYLVC